MQRGLRQFLFASTAFAAFGISQASAGPQGGQVVGGNATIQGQGTGSVTVNQTSDRAIINWQTFNIGKGETTRFMQPSASSVALNRVTGGLGASQIDGILTANGRVFLVNPNGILIGSGAKIDTAGFLATTHDIRNEDFMAGRYNFTQPGRPDASIVNRGTITAQSGGFAALVAPSVRNSGTIVANVGKIGLAAANEFSLDFYGDRLIQLGVNDQIAAQVKDVSTGRTLKSLVTNDGTLRANGGKVELTAVAARTIVNSVINTRGVIEANTIGQKNGMIVLGAATATSKPAGTPSQRVKISGTLSAAGKEGDETGGKIQITGETIELAGAKLDASGRNGGGTVLVGGDWAGGKPVPGIVAHDKAKLETASIANASSVSVDSSSVINASATLRGDGGKVILWADGTTVFEGTIYARGGSNFGNGGFAEVSGKQALRFTGNADLSAPFGSHGVLLLDPLNTTIASIGDWIVTPAAIQAALLNGDVIVTTGSTGNEDGDIRIAETVAWSNSNSLTFSAHRNINFDDGVIIANAGAGNLNLRADNTGLGTGTINISGNSRINWAGSTGQVSLFYNPTGANKFQNPSNYNPFVLTNSTVTNQFNAYMLVNNIFDLQNLNQNLSGSFSLGRNIDASVTVSWNAGAGFQPIGSSSNPFRGKFVGLNLHSNTPYTIDGLRINVNAIIDVGLFGYVNGGAFISDVAMTNAFYSASDFASLGGLVGINRGKIYNSSFSGILHANTPSSPGVVGGLVGANYEAPIVNSHAQGLIVADVADFVGGLAGVVEFSTVHQSTASVHIESSGYPVNGTAWLGGLVGYSSISTITRSSSSGNVAHTTPINAPFLPTIIMGGLVGESISSLISESFASGNISANEHTGAYQGGLVGFEFSGLGIFRSYATGSVSAHGFSVGGGLAATALIIEDSYARGSVSGNSVSGNNSVAGFVYEGGISTSSSYATGPITKLSPTSTVDGFGAFVRSGGTSESIYWDLQTSGQSVSGIGVGLTSTQLKSGLPSGFNPAVWAIDPSVNDGYPHLRWQTETVTPPTSVTTILTGAGATIPPVTPPPAPSSTQSNQVAALNAQFSNQASNGIVKGVSTSPQSQVLFDEIVVNIPTVTAGQPENNPYREAALRTARDVSTLLTPEEYSRYLGRAISIYEYANFIAELTVGLAENTKRHIKNQIPIYVEVYVFDLETQPLSRVIEMIEGSFYDPLARPIIKEMLLFEAKKQGITPFKVDE